MHQETVIRQGPRPEDEYTLISNHLCRSESISARAKVVYLYIRSQKDGWKITVGTVAESLGMSRNTVAAALRDLMEVGYVDRAQGRGEDGRLQRVVYTVYASPQAPRLKNCDTVEDRSKNERRLAQKMSQSGGEVGSKNERKCAQNLSESMLKNCAHKKTKKKTKKKRPPTTPPAAVEDGTESGSSGDTPEPPAVSATAATPALIEAELVPEPKPRTTTTTRTRLPEDWIPSPESVHRIREEFPRVTGEFLRMEHRKFADYWVNIPGKRGLKANWDATWRNWMRRALERHAPTAVPLRVGHRAEDWLPPEMREQNAY